MKLEIDKKISVMVIIAVLANLITFVWWLSSMNNRIDDNVVLINMLSERIHFLEEENEENVKLIDQSQNDIIKLQDSVNYLSGDIL